MNYYVADLPNDLEKARRLLRIKLMNASFDEVVNLVMYLHFRT